MVHTPKRKPYPHCDETRQKPRVSPALSSFPPPPPSSLRPSATRPVSQHEDSHGDAVAFGLGPPVSAITLLRQPTILLLEQTHQYPYPLGITAPPLLCRPDQRPANVPRRPPRPPRCPLPEPQLLWPHRRAQRRPPGLVPVAARELEPALVVGQVVRRRDADAGAHGGEPGL